MATPALRGSVGPAADASAADASAAPSSLTAVLTAPIADQCSSYSGLLFLLSAAALLSLVYAFYERRARIRLLHQIQKVKEVFTTEEWKRPALEIPMTPEEECEAGLDGGLRKRHSSSAKSSVSPTGIGTRDVWVKEN